MLDPETWLPLAQQVPRGKTRKVDHVCGGGRTMRVANEDKGFRAWCFRCNDSGWHPHPTPTLAERIARQKAQDDKDRAVEADRRPPMPAVFEVGSWPLDARVWLYRAGIDNDTIARHGLYYCPPLNRVVIPVADGGRLAYWQARGFEPGRPKYLNPPCDRQDLTARYGDTGPVVVVEDILSAIRVGEVARGWCILGTSTSDAIATAIRRASQDAGCCVWLDPDAAGKRGRAKALTKLSMIGVNPKIITSDKDPKYYSKEELKHYIYGD